MHNLSAFREVVVVDFEFTAIPGERPVPVCLVAHELRSGRCFRIFQDRFGPTPPYAIGTDVLFVAYYASGDLGCYRVLGWPIPERILDPFIEFRDRTNGLPTAAGRSLFGALTHFGLDVGSVDAKKEMQTAIGAGQWEGKYSPTGILDYCEGDVEALKRLFFSMLPKIDLPRALLRGRYMAADSAMVHAGIPTDMVMLPQVRDGWTGIKDQLIAAIDCDYGVYEGTTFKRDRFTNWLIKNSIPWPRLESGQLALDDDTWKHQAKAYPIVSPLRELRNSLSELKLNSLAVGRDGRNRTILSAFGAKTGRNTPSSSKFIFGPATWIRGLIKPPPNHAVVYIDWRQQEFGIAAALSGDRLMQAAYLSGDPYIAFAKQAGAVPADATKSTHSAQRELFKQCALGVNYGMGAQSLALKISQPTIVARDLLKAHRESYKAFWLWSDAAIDKAMLTGSLHTVFGWHVHIGEKSNPRSLRNFPMQGNGSEMLRLACCLATERGIEVCAPLHDAILICAPIDRLDDAIATTRTAMAEASRVVLSGFELGTDVSVTRWPDRYMDPRGKLMWGRVIGLLQQQSSTRLSA